MKLIPGYLDHFISPVTGSFRVQPDYIIEGDQFGRGVPSPGLIDVKLDLLSLRRMVDDIKRHDDWDSQATYILQTASETLPNAQALDELENGLLKQINGVISIAQEYQDYMPAHLNNNSLWVGMKIGPTDNVPTEILVKDVFNYFELTNGYFWIGNNENKPVETNQFPPEALPDCSWGAILRGNHLNKLEETRNYLQGPLEPATFENIAVWGIDDGGLSPIPAGRNIKDSGINISVIGEIQESIDGIIERLDAVEEQIDGINTEIEEIQGEISDIWDAIATIEEVIDGIIGQVESIEARLDAVEADIIAIDADIVTINGEIFFIQGQILFLQGEITRLDGRVDDLHNELESAKATLLALINQLDYDHYNFRIIGAVNGMGVSRVDNTMTVELQHLIDLQDTYQQFSFPETNHNTSFIIKNQFTPLTETESNNDLVLLNVFNNSYRFSHNTTILDSLGNNQGMLSLIAHNAEDGDVKLFDSYVSGGVGNIDFSMSSVLVNDPVYPSEAATKAYVDAAVSGGGTGSVTSVGATTTSIGLSISGSPIETSGTFIFTLNDSLQRFAGVLDADSENRVLISGEPGDSPKWSTTKLIDTFDTNHSMFFGASCGDRGNYNHSFGAFCLLNATDESSYNHAFGQAVLADIGDGKYNCGFGSGVLSNVTDFNGNSVFGHEGFSSMQEGEDNVGLGKKVGWNYYNYNRCTFIGSEVDASFDGADNAIGIGFGVILSASNSIVLGNTNISSFKVSNAFYPTSTTANQLLFSSTNNNVTGLATGFDGVLITNDTGVPSISSLLPEAVQTNITKLGTIDTGIWEGSEIESEYLADTGVTLGSYVYISALTVNSKGQITSITSGSTPGGGTVTSVGATTSSTGLTITNTPITTSGNINFELSAGLQDLSSYNSSSFLKVANNLSDLGSASTARTNLGLTNIATQSVTQYRLLSGGASNAITSLSSGSAGQILQSAGGSANPTFSTATYPASTNANRLLYSSSNNVISELTSANNGVLITSSLGVPSISSTIPSATQDNITRLGTIVSGTWNGGLIASAYLADTAVTGGTYAYPSSVTVNAKGQITNITAGSAPSGGTVTSVGIEGSYGLSVFDSPITSSGVINLVLFDELQGLAGISANGFIKRTGVAAYSSIGTINLSEGGSNASLTASNGGIVYSTASAMAILGGTATARKLLMSGSSAAPTWSTATYPSTTTANRLIYSSAANTVSEMSNVNNSFLISNSSGVLSMGGYMVQNTSNFNMFIGIFAGKDNASGSYNNSFGGGSLGNISSGNSNTAGGYNSLNALTTQSGNAAFGVSSLMQLNGIGASQNSSFGASSGDSWDTYSNCVFMGYDADASVNNLTNAIAIGANSRVGASNTCVIGDENYSMFLGIATKPHAPIHISNSSYTTNRKIVLYENSDNEHQFYGFGINSLALRYQSSGGSHIWYSAINSTSSTELMRLNSSGKVSFMGASNNGEVQLSNNVVNRKIVLFESGNNDHQYFGLGINPSIFRFQVHTTASDFVFYAGNSSTVSSECGRITGAGNIKIIGNTAEKLVGGPWTAYSDIRIKNVQREYKKGLAEILKIRPVVYKFNKLSGVKKELRDEEYIGIVAQEIEGFLPECIKIRKKDKNLKDLRMYDGNAVTYLLINAVKELSARVEFLEKAA